MSVFYIRVKFKAHDNHPCYGFSWLIESFKSLNIQEVRVTQGRRDLFFNSPSSACSSSMKHMVDVSKYAGKKGKKGGLRIN